MRSRLSLVLAITMALGSVPVALNAFAVSGGQDKRGDEKELRDAREQLKRKLRDLEEQRAAERRDEEVVRHDREAVRHDEEEVRRQRELIRKLERDLRHDR